tara:strand:- start:93 stop:509 length:417 start_codon:yes stop_codon:yes gene_type:complete
VQQALVGLLAVVVVLVLTKLSQVQKEALVVGDQIILIPLLMLVQEMVLLVDHLQFHEFQWMVMQALVAAVAAVENLATQLVLVVQVSLYFAIKLEQFSHLDQVQRVLLVEVFTYTIVKLFTPLQLLAPLQHLDHLTKM